MPLRPLESACLKVSGAVAEMFRHKHSWDQHPTYATNIQLII
jgi:hypothetical protein